MELQRNATPVIICEGMHGLMDLQMNATLMDLHRSAALVDLQRIATLMGLLGGGAAVEADGEQQDPPRLRGGGRAPLDTHRRGHVHRHHETRERRLVKPVVRVHVVRLERVWLWRRGAWYA